MVSMSVCYHQPLHTKRNPHAPMSICSSMLMCAARVYAGPYHHPQFPTHHCTHLKHLGHLASQLCCCDLSLYYLEGKPRLTLNEVHTWDYNDGVCNWSRTTTWVTQHDSMTAHKQATQARHPQCKHTHTRACTHTHTHTLATTCNICSTHVQYA